MFTESFFIPSEHISEHKSHDKLHRVLSLKMKHSIPKLYIPKTNGRTCIKKRWHVYFYYDDPETGKRDYKCKFSYYHGINRYKSISERREFGNRLIEVYTELLADGWNPWENKLVLDEFSDFGIKKVNVIEAMEAALRDKERNLKTTSYEDVRWRIRRFIRFAKDRRFDTLSSKDLTRMHVVRFLDHRKDEGENATSINNYRAS